MIKTKIVTFDRGLTKDSNKIVEKWEMIHTRKIDRMVLKSRMKKKGIRQMSKHGYSGSGYKKSVTPSWFAEHWREVREEIV